MEECILKTEHLSIAFGGLKALTDFNIELKKGELVGLIGPNGAGKTTVFNLLTGVYKPTDGSMTLMGKPVGRRIRPDQLVRRGVARTFQNIRLFKNLTVLENVMIASNFQMRYSVLGAMFRLGSFWREEEHVRQKALSLLDVFELRECADMLADNLPYGRQRKLEIARALSTDPKLLLLDEPAAGMNPTETKELMQTISLIRERFGVTILLIEHDMSLVLGICERILVLDYGMTICQGTPDEVVNDPKVIAAYLGE